VTNSEGGLEKRGSRHDALGSGKFHRRQAGRAYCIAGESPRERSPLPKGTEKKEKKRKLKESDTPQQELSRCLNEMFLALRRLAIAKLSPEEEEE
jgi:hypothetical protein